MQVASFTIHKECEGSTQFTKAKGLNLM